MTTVAIIDNWPVFALGLAQALHNAGLRAIVVDPAALDRGAERVDAILLAPEAIPDRPLREVVSRAAATAPVLLLVHREQDAGDSGADGVVCRSTPLRQLLDTVCAVSGAAPHRTGHPASDASAPLSERERQVIWLISRGHTIQRIARMLAISPHTVDTYIKRVRAKLGLGNKAELACAALDYPPAEPWNAGSLNAGSLNAGPLTSVPPGFRATAAPPAA